jgi:putative endonuclease
MAYYAYVLRSLVDGRLYKGHTEDIKKRLEEHNLGKSKSTKGYLPWELVYLEKFETRKEAIEREKYFKTGIGREFIASKLK